jgi:hypothetical protein
MEIVKATISNGIKELPSGYYIKNVFTPKIKCD